MLLSIFGGLTGVILVVAIIAFSFAIALSALELFATITAFAIRIKSRRMRKLDISNGHTTAESVRVFLDSNGMSDVPVQEAGFWRGLFFGNHYSIKHNVFYIRKRQMNVKNLANVTDSVQRVAKAVEYKEGSKGTKALIKFQSGIVFMPYLVIPIVLIGVIIDALLFHFEDNYLVSLIAAFVGLAFFIFAAILMFMTIKVEKKSNQRALEMMQQSNFLNEEEYGKVESIFKWRIILYVVNFIIALIRIIQLLFKILGIFLKRGRK